MVKMHTVQYFRRGKTGKLLKFLKDWSCRLHPKCHWQAQNASYKTESRCTQLTTHSISRKKFHLKVVFYGENIIWWKGKDQTLFESERPIYFWLTHFLFQIGLQSDPIYRGNFVKLSPQEHCENEIKCLKVKGRGKLLKGEIERVNREIKLGITLGKQRGQNFSWQIFK